MGTRIDVDPASGDVGEIRTNVRIILPRSGCLRCNEFINPTKVQEDSLPQAERERNRYVDEIPAPSVITFNTLAAAQGATDFLLMLGELINDDATIDFLRFRPRDRTLKPIEPAPNDPSCIHCGGAPTSKRARGDSIELPVRES
jgi:hypothetical protein